MGGTLKNGDPMESSLMGGTLKNVMILCPMESSLMGD